MPAKTWWIPRPRNRHKRMSAICQRDIAQVSTMSKHAQAGSKSSCPMSAEISTCGHAHASYAFPVRTVHFVVDSGELGQPDVTFGPDGMARRPAYNNAHAGKIILLWKFRCRIFIFCKSARDSASPPQPRGLVSGM